MTTTLNSRIDHIIIGAATLEQGQAYISEQLGVEVPRGGEHDMMATHNCVMQLGNDIYLEIIAINPQAPPPSHPRWFSLDQSWMRQRLQTSPALIHWAINTNNINTLMKTTNLPFGIPAALQRDALKWKVGLPVDGSLPMGGLLPSVIEWQVQPHPANHMADLGCKLENIEIHHPRQKWLKTQLELIDMGDKVTTVKIDDAEAPSLQVVIDSPNGQVRLNSSQ